MKKAQVISILLATFMFSAGAMADEVCGQIFLKDGVKSIAQTTFGLSVENPPFYQLVAVRALNNQEVIDALQDGQRAVCVEGYAWSIVGQVRVFVPLRSYPLTFGAF